MTNNGYPPSAGPYNQHQPPSDPQLLDPFFDDDDDGMPDSAFGRPPAMESRESGLPLSRSAAAPAGHSKVTLGDGVPQGWNFDDEDLMPSNQTSFSGSAAFPGTKTQVPKSAAPKRKKWKWPWEKEKHLTGERVIALNNSALNGEFSSNFISTSKYSLATFGPKFLFGMCILALCFLVGCVFTGLTEQFSKYANLFFLFTACIQQIPGVSPTNQYTTIAPLAVVLLASALKEAQEDLVSCNISASTVNPLKFLQRNAINPMLNSTRGQRR
jgi:phospholipid-transporting ATPase